MEVTTLYLIWYEIGNGEALKLNFDGDAHPVADSLWLVRSPLSRSRLYHAIKRQLPVDTALLVAPLDDDPDGWPKFKGGAPGALAWLRKHPPD
ncbi:MAG: hypothetical protein JY451_12610 [Erythrobacter sp.]|nr:MAG: hypothetical protein JY451_12610 [Erythrobacter sp.]